MTTGVVPQMRLRRTPSTGVFAWVRDFAEETEVATLGDLAVAAILIPAQTTAALVDEMFRGDERLRYVIVQDAGGPVLVDRSWFEFAITGRLGFGRLLHARKRILELGPEPTLVLAHDCTIETAAAKVIAGRSPGHPANAVVVAWPGGGLGVAHVSTIFERLARHYSYQSWHDPLTGLPNRRFLLEQLRAVEQTRGVGVADWGVVLYHLDLDRFKTINDEFGHRGGDQVLVQFAQRIRAVAPLEDLVVRLGGDEFAILSLAPTSVAHSGAFAARLVREAADPFVVEMLAGPGGAAGRVARIGVSVGVAHAVSAQPGEPATSLDSLLGQADGAMYWAKERGRGRAEHYATLGATAGSTGLDPTRLTQARRGPAAPSM